VTFLEHEGDAVNDLGAGDDLHGRGDVGERDRGAGGQIGFDAHGDDLCGGLRQGVHGNTEAGCALVMVGVRMTDDEAVERLAELLGVGENELRVDGDDPRRRLDQLGVDVQAVLRRAVTVDTDRSLVDHREGSVHGLLLSKCG
jgi:hypothetical protein